MGVWDVAWPEGWAIIFGVIVDDDGVGCSNLLFFSGVADVGIGGVLVKERFCVKSFLSMRFMTGENCSYHPKFMDCRSNC